MDDATATHHSLHTFPRDKDFDAVTIRDDVKSELLAAISYSHCHNEAAVVCLICQTEQEVAQVCSKCGVCMGEYFCDACKFFDDDTSKEQFHCDDCGICRVGGRDRFFHCQNCGSCYEMGLLNKHSCIHQNSTKNCCPVCYEYLFDSVKAAHVMKCGHTMHMDCFKQMVNEQQYRCPICSKSALDMSTSWQLLGLECDRDAYGIYNYEVAILCNDCNKEGKTMFHILGHKCGHCGSYNTRRISTPQDPV